MCEALLLIDMAYIFKCVRFNTTFKAWTLIVKLAYSVKSTVENQLLIWKS